MSQRQRGYSFLKYCEVAESLNTFWCWKTSERVISYNVWPSKHLIQKLLRNLKAKSKTNLTNIDEKGFCANEREQASSSAMIRGAYKSLTGGKDELEGRLWSAGAIRWKGNVKTNDRDTGGQISPAAEAAGPEVTGEVGGARRGKGAGHWLIESGKYWSAISPVCEGER